ncbi:MAG: acyltransferase, partial [Ruminococcus sp.]|nr:acyltransferase [Ruminococcus sp.]
IIGTWKLSVEAGYIVETFKGDTNIPCILYAVGVFVFFRENGNRIMEGKAGKAIEKLAKYTFSVYLMHWFVIDVLVRLFDINTLSIIYRLVAPFIIVPICILATLVLRKIPLIRHIVP